MVSPLTPGEDPYLVFGLVAFFFSHLRTKHSQVVMMLCVGWIFIERLVKLEWYITTKRKTCRTLKKKAVWETQTMPTADRLIWTLFHLTFTSYRLCHIFFTLPPSDCTELQHVDLLCKAMIAPTHNYNPDIWGSPNSVNVLPTLLISYDIKRGAAEPQVILQCLLETKDVWCVPHKRITF